MTATLAGSIRARILEVIPELQVYRNEAPTGVSEPLVVISDPFSTVSEDLGSDVVLNEELQLDIYLPYGSISNLADQIHATLHRATIDYNESQVYRCSVSDRVYNIAGEGNDDGIYRITMTVVIRRMLTL
jgi:hypothetical protein